MNIKELNNIFDLIFFKIKLDLKDFHFNVLYFKTKMPINTLSDYVKRVLTIFFKSISIILVCLNRYPNKVQPLLSVDMPQKSLLIYDCLTSPFMLCNLFKKKPKRLGFFLFQVLMILKKDPKKKIFARIWAIAF